MDILFRAITNIDPAKAVERIADGARIPADPTLCAWAEYQDYLKAGGVLGPVADPPAPNLAALALTALAEDDAVAVRCVKAGVAYPADWLARDVALRAIVNGTDTTSTEIPARPSSYPAGT